MSYQEKLHEWTYQVAAIIHNKNEKERRQNKNNKDGVNMNFIMHPCQD